MARTLEKAREGARQRREDGVKKKGEERGWIDGKWVLSIIWKDIRKRKQKVRKQGDK
jgi:hypothetical protein